MIDYVITTVDNPYNPIVQPDEWRHYDEHQGYYTNQLVARIAPELAHEYHEDVNEKLLFDVYESLMRLFPDMYTLAGADTKIVPKKIE